MTDHIGQLTTPAAVAQFILAGNARLTLVSKETGTRYTIRVRQGTARKPGDRPLYFASVLTGADNERDYNYIGFLRHDGAARAADGEQLVDLWNLYAGKKGQPNQPAFKGLAWLLKQVSARQLTGIEELPEQLEVWHEGRCGRCGRALTVPESIESGFGPECITKVNAFGVAA